MKVQKRCMVMSVVLVLVLNLITGLTALAAEGNIISPVGGLKTGIDTSKHKVQVASFEVVIPADSAAGYAFRFLNDDGTSTPYGNLRFRTNGKVAANTKAEDWGADWLENDNYNKSSYKMGTPFNLAARLNMETGTVDFYMDGKWFYRQKGTGTTPWYALAVISETTNAVPTVSLKYSVGFAEDEIGVYLSNADENNKTVTVEFTENVAGDLADTKLKRVNGGTEIALSNPVISGSSVTFTYAEDLASASEYALVLPGNIKGAKYGNALNDRYLYFYTDDKKVKSEQLIDFEEESYDPEETGAFKITQSKSPYGVMSELTQNGKDGGRALTVKSDTMTGTELGSSAAMNWSNISIPSDGVQTVSFDILPLRSDLSFATRFLTVDDNAKTPIIAGLTQKGKIVGGYAFDIYQILQGDDSWWNNRMVRGSYAQDKWVNIKIEWDNLRKTGVFYIDGTPTSVTTSGYELETKASAYSGIDHVRMYLYQNLMGVTEAGTSLFVLDNISVTESEKPAVVRDVIFKDTDNNTVKTFGRLEKPLSAVDISFSDAMPLADVTASDNIKLYYGDTEVAYTAQYNEDDKCYSLTPVTATVTEPGKNYRIEVTGITASSGLTVEDYSCYVETDTEAFINAGISIVNASGTEVTEIVPGVTYTIKGIFTSSISSVPNIPILIAQYSEGNRLESISVETISEDTEIPFTIDANADIYPEKIGIFAWYSMGSALPLCKPVTVSVVSQ